VQVQSSWFPVIDRNPQKFVPSIYKAQAGDFRPAIERVYSTPEMPSHLTLPVMP
jgi:predicted acyl esterase